MKALLFDTAVMVLTDAAATSCFSDGVFNQLWLTEPGDHPAFAREAGYGEDWRRYIVEHDVLHHLVADELGQPWSWALHDGDGSVPVDQAPQRIRDEEHLVQSLQRRIMLGVPDRLGCLDRAFAPLGLFVHLAARRLNADLGSIRRPGLAH